MLIFSLNVELIKSVDDVYNKYIRRINDFGDNVRLQQQRITVVLRNVVETSNVYHRLIVLVEKFEYATRFIWLPLNMQSDFEDI